MAKDLPSSKSLRAGLRAAGKPDRWDMGKRPVKAGYSPHDVQMHAVNHSGWQYIRLRMKGQDTVDKLLILFQWWDNQMDEAKRVEFDNVEVQYAQQNEVRAKALRWATEVQVGNYLGALRRGGQLDDENKIRKAR